MIDVEHNSKETLRRGEKSAALKTICHIIQIIPL
jgi:hypothetical protein